MGFLPGAAVGGAAGLTNGLITGTGNSLVAGNKFGDSFLKGLDAAWKQGIVGGAVGGIAATIAANTNGTDLLTGRAKGSIVVTFERLNINIPEQRAEMASDGMGSDIRPFYVDSELDFDGNQLNWIDYYSDGSQRIRDSWEAWSGGCPPRESNIWGGRIVNGEWILNSIETGEFADSYMLHGVGFKGRITANFNLLPPREPGTFLIHPDGNVFGSNGCIVLQCGTAERLNLFVNYTERYLNQCGFLSVNVYY